MNQPPRWRLVGYVTISTWWVGKKKTGCCWSSQLLHPNTSFQTISLGAGRLRFCLFVCFSLDADNAKPHNITFVMLVFHILFLWSLIKEKKKKPTALSCILWQPLESMAARAALLESVNRFQSETRSCLHLKTVWQHRCCEKWMYLRPETEKTTTRLRLLLLLLLSVKMFDAQHKILF